VDNVAPESLYVDDEEFIQLHTLSEFQCESILAEWMEMLCSKHAMSKALHQVTSTVGDECDGKECSNAAMLFFRHFLWFVMRWLLKQHCHQKMP
jgi:hypothetical protein